MATRCSSRLRADRGMFIVAVILLTAVKLGLRLFPFRVQSLAENGSR